MKGSCTGYKYSDESSDEEEEKDESDHDHHGHHGHHHHNEEDVMSHHSCGHGHPMLSTIQRPEGSISSFTSSEDES